MPTIKQFLYFSCLVVFLFSCKPKSTETSDQPVVHDIDSVQNSLVEITMAEHCGISYEVSEFTIDSLKIKPNQLMHQWLEPYHLTGEQLKQISLKSKGVFELRKLQSGKWVSLIQCADSIGELAYFIYHDSPQKKVVFRLIDSVDIYIYELPIDTIKRSISSRIERTLYHSILNNNTTYELGIKLSEVFAWQVDFFKIDANDYFKVFFEEYRVNNEVVGIGNISCAEFYHRGDTFRAYAFYQDERDTYFDENGKSLRKAFLKAPLKYSRISSRYTKRRFHPVQRRWKAHLGTDYAASTGTPIRSVGDGVVIASAYGAANGNYVKVKHNSTYTTQYLHMSRRAVKNGARVSQGQVIGYVGSTGLATGPHLCFRFWMNGQQVDPFSVKIPPSVPISSENQALFNQMKDSLNQAMNLLQLPPIDSSKSAEKDIET